MNAVISARILTLITAGKTLREAFDEVLGEGSYEALAGDLHSLLREKASR